MAKDMYKKRKERQENRNNNQDNQGSKTNINWLMETYGNTHSNLYKIRILTN
ncbi:MAG: hypothetical protein PHP54_03115 [Clostridia bacterium]|nr:hypothetical protein [Clostridia bacterium]